MFHSKRFSNSSPKKTWKNIVEKNTARIKFSIVADFIIPEIAWSSTEQQNLEANQRGDKTRQKNWIFLGKNTLPIKS